MKNKPFKESEIRWMLQQVTTEKISFSRMVEMINNKAKAFALEACKESLRNASNNAMLSTDGITDKFFTCFGEGGCSTVIVCDESILSESNIPKEIIA